MNKMDAKFYGVIRKAKDDSIVPPDEYIVFLIKDNAFWLALNDYREHCKFMGCDPRQMDGIDAMIDRVGRWRQINRDRYKIPDFEQGETYLNERSEKTHDLC